MSSKVSAKLKYKSDNMMEKGLPALLTMLVITTLLFLLIFAMLVIFVAKKFNFPESSKHAFWCVFIHMLDPGTITADEVSNFGYIFVMLFVTLCGIIINSILIGTITSAIDDKLKSLRAGKSKIIEKNHTVIMGLNDSAYIMINELILANENKKKGCVVVISNEKHSSMVEKIQCKISNSKNTKIICRSGNPLEEHFLDICSIGTAKSIIINYDDDFYTMKQLLSISRYIENKMDNKFDFHVVCLIKDKKNLAPAKFIGKNFADIIFIEDMIARIIAHSCRYPGLSKVFSDIFTFKDNEIHYETMEKLDGMSFRDTLFMFNNSSVLGFVKNGIPKLNPPMDTIFNGKEDKLILLERDNKISKMNECVPKFNTKDVINPNIVNDKINEKRNLLILGQNELLFDILKEFDKYVGEDSAVTLVDLNVDINPENIPNFRNISFKMENCDFYDKNNIKKLLINNQYDTVLLLCDLHSSYDVSDASIIVTLANIRSLIETYGLKINIISEMRSADNQKLLYHESISDFIVGANITSLIISQISENGDLLPIFGELLDESGSEFYMKPISRYVKPGIPVDVYQLQGIGERYREIIIGYKKYDGKQYKLYINPEKDKKEIFSDRDYAVVVAID